MAALEQFIGFSLHFRRDSQQVGLQPQLSRRTQESLSKDPAMRFLDRDTILRRLLAESLNHGVFQLSDDQLCHGNNVLSLIALVK